MRKNALPRRLRIAAAALVLLIFGASFSGLWSRAAVFFHLQAAPALISCSASFGAGCASVIAGIALLTFLFGRFYCAFFCPLGIWQDLTGFLSRRKCAPLPDAGKLRMALAGLVCGALAGGTAAGFLLLDPYSNAGRMAAAFLAGGFIPFLLITALAAWKKRLFCTAACPVGTLLGLLSRRGLFRLGFTLKCVKCGLCVKVCPAGCMDPAAGLLDNERCVRCMNCLDVCRTEGVKFRFGPAMLKPVSPGRREFLIRSGILLGGLAAGFALAKAGTAPLRKWAAKSEILPPGAVSPERFTAKCTSCQLCAANCPEKIIVPAPGGYGPVSLDLSRGRCRYDCNKCSEVCPTGALLPLTLPEKQKTKIAEAKLDPKNCIVFQEGTPCGRCAAACPVHAVVLRKSGAPRPVNTRLCIGCGACQQICPAEKKAMTIHFIPKQDRIP